MTAYARRRLREKFLRAEMGITGCNFGVAEADRLRWWRTRATDGWSPDPEMHVVVMGMERLVPPSRIWK